MNELIDDLRELVRITSMLAQSVALRSESSDDRRVYLEASQHLDRLRYSIGVRLRELKEEHERLDRVVDKAHQRIDALEGLEPPA